MSRKTWATSLFEVFSEGMCFVPALLTALAEFLVLVDFKDDAVTIDNQCRFPKTTRPLFLMQFFSSSAILEVHASPIKALDHGGLLVMLQNE